MTLRLAFSCFALFFAIGITPGPARDADSQAADSSPLIIDGPSSTEQERLDRLFDRLAKAESAEDARRYETSIDQIWSRSGSDTADLLAMRAVDLVAGADQDGAQRLLEAALRAKPDYAEGWNKRATLYFLEGDYSNAMKAIRETLRYEPRHYTAWAGLGRILQQTGDDRKALAAYRRALAIHPHLDGLKAEADALAAKIRGEEL